MQVVRYTDAAAFSRIVTPLLSRAEAENNLPLGICAGLESGPPPSRPPYLATIESASAPVGVAIMTPPYKLVLSAAPHEALEAVCDDLVAAEISVPGAVGPMGVAQPFAAMWGRRTGADVGLERRLRIYQLTSVVSPRSVTGQLRPCDAGDLAIVEPWALAFVVETRLDDDVAEITETVRRAVGDGRLYVWDDARPLAMAAWTGPTPNGARVTLVYTPPALRGRGYASACVAELSALLLRSGRKHCFLFTDLANPTSNSIYMKLGYRPVCDVHEYRFDRGR